jgi:hypothetical protein
MRRPEAPSHWSGCDAALRQGPASLNKPNNENNHGQHQQEVDQPAGGVRGENSNKPQNREDEYDCPKHVFDPFILAPNSAQNLPHIARMR